MRTISLLIILSVLLLFSSFTENGNCEQLIRKARTENYDISVLGSFHFETKDSFETLSNRGVQEAYYFSCDGSNGYLFIKTHEKSIIYQQIPFTIWKSFKMAETPEQFYVEHIKYQFKTFR